MQTYNSKTDEFEDVDLSLSTGGCVLVGIVVVGIVGFFLAGVWWTTGIFIDWLSRL